jgi:hypothetical protein
MVVSLARRAIPRAAVHRLAVDAPFARAVTCPKDVHLAYYWGEQMFSGR